MQNELERCKYKVNSVPLYIVYENRGKTKNKIMFFKNKVDVCLLFYRGKPNQGFLVNPEAKLRTDKDGNPDLSNVKYYNATRATEVKS